MPQMNKGGKFVFGKSRIREDGSVWIPPQAVAEYGMANEERAILFTGSRSTGGFCVTRRGLLEPSKLGHILSANPDLRDGRLSEGKWVRYKGRGYCWVRVSAEGKIVLTDAMQSVLEVSPGMELMAIRSSNIAFTMGAKGPLLARAAQEDERIERF